MDLDAISVTADAGEPQMSDELGHHTCFIPVHHTEFSTQRIYGSLESEG